MTCACPLPHGSPPSTLQRIQYACGVEFFDHPITPFEQALWRAAVQGVSFQGVVRGLLQLHGMEACPVVIELLHWYLERSGYPRRSFVRVRAITQPYVDRIHRAIELHRRMVLPNVGPPLGGEFGKSGKYFYGLETEGPCRTSGCKGSVSSSQRGTTDGLCHMCWRPR